MPPAGRRVINAFATALAGLGAAALVAMLLHLAGRPLATDDLWWHLALGRAYAQEGLWLGADPLLFSASSAPAPASWLFDLALHGVERATGLQGLRALHVLAVAGILLGVWSLCRRAGASAAIAALATGVFAVVASYRMVQLRPELVSVAASLVLYRLLLVAPERSSRARVAAAALLVAVWANAHAAFLVGPLLLAAGLAGLLIARPFDRQAVFRVAQALALGLLLALANPRGAAQHLAFLTAAGQTHVWSVADEWSAFHPFARPAETRHLPLLSWALTDLLLALTLLGVAVGVVRWLRAGHRLPSDFPAVPAALALAACVATLAAIRFQWLLVFVLLFVLRVAPPRVRAPAAGGALAAGLASLLLALGFWRSEGYAPGSFGVTARLADYLARPVAAAKYYGQAVWFLREAALEGNLFGQYFMGGFQSYWLAPSLRSFVNGTLNFPPEVGRDYRVVTALRSREVALARLDAHAVDVFLGVGLPTGRDPRKPRRYTSAHLEGAPGWIPIFRNAQSAVYLRADARNRENLARAAAWYATQGVPFDAERGFDAGRVLEQAPEWAVAHGLAPTRPAAPAEALARRARLEAALGLHARQIETDTALLTVRPNDTDALRRLVHGLLWLGRDEDARGVARRLARAAPQDPRTRRFVDAARRARGAPDAAVLTRLPLFTPEEATRLATDLAPPPSLPGG